MGRNSWTAVIKAFRHSLRLWRCQPTRQLTYLFCCGLILTCSVLARSQSLPVPLTCASGLQEPHVRQAPIPQTTPGDSAELLRQLEQRSEQLKKQAQELRAASTAALEVQKELEKLRSNGELSAYLDKVAGYYGEVKKSCGPDHVNTMQALLLYANELVTVGGSTKGLRLFEEFWSTSKMDQNFAMLQYTARILYLNALLQFKQIEDARRFMQEHWPVPDEALVVPNPESGEGNNVGEEGAINEIQSAREDPTALLYYLAILLATEQIDKARPIVDRLIVAWKALEKDAAASAPNAAVEQELNAINQSSLDSILGEFYRIEGKDKEALASFRRAYEVYGPSRPELYKHHLSVAFSYAIALREQNMISEALPLFEDILKVHSQHFPGRHPNSAKHLAALAETMYLSGKHSDALKMWARFVDVVEQVRVHAGSESRSMQRQQFERYMSQYQSFAFALNQAGQPNEAFEILEMTKARTLLEQMAESETLRSGIIPDTDAKRLQDLNDQITAIEVRLAKSEDQEARNILKRLDREESDLRAKLKKEHPRFAKVTEIEFAAVPDAPQLLSPDELFVSYMVVDGQRVFALTLDNESNVGWFDLGSIPGLGDSVEALRKWIGQPAGKASPLASWEENGVRRWRSVPERKPCPQEDLKPQRALSRVRTNDTWGNLRPMKSIGSFSDAGGSPVGGDCVPPGARILESSTPEGKNAGDPLIVFLSNKLIEPLKAKLVGKRRIIISPDGPLGLLAFDVLKVEGQPLIASFDLSLIHSFSVLKLVQQRIQNQQAEGESAQALRPLLAFGDPNYKGTPPTYRTNECAKTKEPWKNLNYSAKEISDAKALFKLQDHEAITQNDATETKLRTISSNGDLANYRHVLFSAHGYFDPCAPSRSGLVLRFEDDTPARDGYVTTGEWANLTLRSYLTILSACDTARGRTVGGEGLIGLAYALYVAGNANTVATLWPVDDKRSARFVTVFLARLPELERTNPRHAVAQALAETKREFLDSSDPVDRHPYFWAPFVLYGR